MAKGPSVHIRATYIYICAGDLIASTRIAITGVFSRFSGVFCGRTRLNLVLLDSSNSGVHDARIVAAGRAAAATAERPLPSEFGASLGATDALGGSQKLVHSEVYKQFIQHLTKKIKSCI